MSKKKVEQHPPIHVVLYGPQGTGKSTMAQSFAKAHLDGLIGGPMLVLMFDPRGKDAPYLCKRPEDAQFYGVKPGELSWVDGAEDLGIINQLGQKYQLSLPYEEVYAGEQLLTRVEYFHEEDLEFGDEADDIAGWTVLPKIRKRLNSLFREERDLWGTVVWDSTTSSELVIRSYHQFVQNKGARGEAQKKWWGASTDEHEKILAVRFNAWRGNFIVICHTDKEKASEEAGGGILRYNPRLPGRLSSDLSSYYAEVYHSFAERDPEGNVSYMLQTRPSDKFTAFSSFLKAPDPCENTYEALWSNW